MNNTLKNEFSNGKHFINVTTVGELKAALEELDEDLTVQLGFSSSVDVMIYHNSHGIPFLSFEDGESN